MPDITTTNVSIPLDGTEIVGFLARPAGGASHPGVIVIQEWWGLNDHIRDIAERLARAGFAALAPDLYEGKVTKDPAVAGTLMQALDHETGLRRLNAAVAYLKSQPYTTRIGAIGFCMGGTYAMLLACRNNDVRASVPYYGQVPEADVLQSLNAPVMYVYAGLDKWITKKEVDRLDAYLSSSRKAGEVVRYPNADHAFFNDTRPQVYNPADAADAWRRTVDFLARNLAA